MKNGWERAEYEIQVHQGTRIYSETVYGITRGGFGIHETDSGWNVTHLASGWNCFTVMSRLGAVVIAHYLIRNYASDFERLKISRATLENYKPLLEKIAADAELADIKSRFTDERKGETSESQREIELKIIS